MHGLIGSLAHCPPISNVQVDRRYLERPGNVCIDGPQVRGLELGSGTWTGECQHRACYPHSTSEPKLTPTSTIRTKRAWPCCENSPRPPRHTAQNASPSLAMQVGGGCLDLGIGYECVKMPSLVSGRQSTGIVNLSPVGPGDIALSGPLFKYPFFGRCWDWGQGRN